jgi:hypothetical protein
VIGTVIMMTGSELFGQADQLPSFIDCPDCGRLAEVTDRFVLDSTDGPVDHVALSCIGGHHFRMAADRLPAPVTAGPATRRLAATGLATTW